ncbi:MAG: hypothetical protein AAFV88_10830 [Planctomycetota bacterium]
MIDTPSSKPVGCFPFIAGGVVLGGIIAAFDVPTGVGTVVMVLGVGMPVWVFVAIARAKNRLAHNASEKKQHDYDYMEKLIDAVRQNPGDAIARNKLIVFGQRHPELSTKCYEFSLGLVTQSNGAPEMKEMALILGRASYGSKRPGNSPTTYDEKAIENDIQFRID